MKPAPGTKILLRRAPSIEGRMIKPELDGKVAEVIYAAGGQESNTVILPNGLPGVIWPESVAGILEPAEVRL
jgi:hypothetical protein